MRIAVIPARGGSKRVPRKNIRDFCGKPMICYAIEVARSSGLFDHIIVSTDDKQISSISSACGAEIPFNRPAALADDHTPTVPVIAHAINACAEFGWYPDTVCCIYPTVPLIQPDDLVQSLHLLEQGKADYVFPVAPYPSAPQRALRQTPGGLMEPINSQYVLTRTQDLEPAFYDAGQFYWGRTSTWLDQIAIHGNGAGLVIPAWRVVDIDTEEDWRRAELVFKALESAAGHR